MLDLDWRISMYVQVCGWETTATTGKKEIHIYVIRSLRAKRKRREVVSLVVGDLVVLLFKRGCMHDTTLSDDTPHHCTNFKSKAADPDELVSLTRTCTHVLTKLYCMAIVETTAHIHCIALPCIALRLLAGTFFPSNASMLPCFHASMLPMLPCFLLSLALPCLIAGAVAGVREGVAVLLWPGSR